MPHTLKPTKAGVALSVAGSSHLRAGKACDDACRLRFSGGGWLAVLADGAGSARRSGEGARLAVETAAAWLQQNPITPADPAPERQLRRCFAVARQSLVTRARRAQCDLAELATTLLVAVVRKGLALSMGVGDGAFVVRLRGGAYATLNREKKAGPANVADFLTDADFRERARFRRLEGDFDALAGVTDGLEPLAFSADRKPFAPFFDPLLACVRHDPPREATRKLHDFLTGDRLRSASDDDLSIVLAHLEARP